HDALPLCGGIGWLRAIRSGGIVLLGHLAEFRSVVRVFPGLPEHRRFDGADADVEIEADILPGAISQVHRRAVADDVPLVGDADAIRGAPKTDVEPVMRRV